MLLILKPIVINLPNIVPEKKANVKAVSTEPCIHEPKILPLKIAKPIYKISITIPNSSSLETTLFFSSCQ